MATFTVKRTKTSDSTVDYLCVTNNSLITWGDPKQPILGPPATIYYYIGNTMAVMSILLWVLQNPVTASGTYTYQIVRTPG